eukprot:scaffold14275_cov221-Alexandrium_tamarense.AAC.5
MNTAFSLLSTSIALLLVLQLILSPLPSSAARTHHHPSKSTSSESLFHRSTPTTSILPIKSLNLHHHAEDHPTTGRRKDEFDRLNKQRKFGRVTRDSVYEAVVHMKRQKPSYDIVVMGATSLN